MQGSWKALLLPGLVVLPLLASAQAQQAPRMRVDPSVPLMTEDDYPALAAREGRQGRVGMRLSINATGRVAACDVVQSSSHVDLDATACNLMMQRARYKPATDAAGNQIAGTVTTGLNWRLPADAPSPVYTGSSSGSSGMSALPIIARPEPSPPSSGMSASQQMNADLQRNAADLLARKKKQ